MKRAIIAAILGIATCSSTSHATGYIYMDNYFYDGTSPTPVYSGVTLYPGGPYVGHEFNAQLLYQYGSMLSYSVAPGSFTSFYPGAVTGGSPATDGAGIFIGPMIVTIPGYTSGPVNFIVEVFNGPDLFSSTIFGISPSFTISSLQTDILLAPAAGDLLQVVNGVATGLQPFSIIPEPSSLAVLGLGVGMTAMWRRRDRKFS